jgi:hypothetical protein
MDCCEGHTCDECDTCLSGICCGADVIEPDLPYQGSWPNEMYGKVGVLLEKDDKVQCHICGNWYVELGRHSATKHKVNADQYRAYFGLACGRALCPEWFSKKRSDKAKAEGLGHSRTQDARLTSEQYSLIAYRREARIETAIKRKDQLTKIARKGAEARWAKDRPQNAQGKVKLRRYPIE